MRVAIILSSAAGGGAERAMIAIANRLAANGHGVSLVFIRASGPFIDLIASDVSIVDLGEGRARKSLRPLNRYVAEQRPDLIISALVVTDLLVLIGKLLFGWRSHIHISVQNMPPGVDGGSRDPLERQWPWLMRTIYRAADSVSAISTGVAQRVSTLMRWHAGPIPVVHNSVDLASIAASVAQPCEIDWMTDGGSPVLVATGRLVEQKDYRTLLQALARLDHAQPVRLVILGIGPERERLQREADRLGLNDRVRFAGFSTNPFAVMAAADVFVLSSRWEGFANVIAEALACGAKVVSTDCPSGPAEILNHGQFGWLVPVGDAAAMARAIRSALDADIDREPLMARARDFAVERIVGQLCDVLRQHGLAA